MEPLLGIGLANVALAALLAVAVLLLGRAWRRPALLRCRWLLVLLKLLSPPLLPLPILAPEEAAAEPPAPTPQAEAVPPEPAVEPFAFELKLEPSEPPAPAT